MKILNQNVFFKGQLENNQNKNNSVMTSPLKSKSLTKDTVSFSGLIAEAPKVAEIGIAAVKKVNLNVKTLDDIAADLSGKVVRLKADNNVSFDELGAISDDTRIKETLPTIKELIDRKAKVVIMTHIGDPFKLKDGKMGEKISTKIVAERLQELLRKEKGYENIEVIHTKRIVGKSVEEQSKNLKPNQILYLENVRFIPAETGNGVKFNPENNLLETKEVSVDLKKKYAKKLAQGVDIFVNDAFGAAHRDHGSITGLTEYIDGSKVAGRLMEKEINGNIPFVEDVKGPFVVIIGGKKMDKAKQIKDFINVMKPGDSIILGGAMANTFILAKGGKLGNSLVESKKIELAKELMEKAEAKGINLILPVDAVAAKDKNSIGEIMPADNIKEGFSAFDIGPKTVKIIGSVIDGAKTVYGNCVMGLVEKLQFANGSNSTLIKISEATSSAKTEIAGGDTITAANKAGIDLNSFTFASTGGGATSTFIGKKGDLPAIKVLDKK